MIVFQRSTCIQARSCRRSVDVLCPRELSHPAPIRRRSCSFLSHRITQWQHCQNEQTIDYRIHVESHSDRSRWSVARPTWWSSTRSLDSSFHFNDWFEFIDQLECSRVRSTSFSQSSTIEHGHHRTIVFDRLSTPSSECSFKDEEEIIWKRLSFDDDRPLSSADCLFLLSTVESNGSNADFGAEAMRLTRTISPIIDGFHFHGTDDLNTGEGQRITRAIQSVYCRWFSIDPLTNSDTATKNTTVDEQRQSAVLVTVACVVIARNWSSLSLLTWLNNTSRWFLSIWSLFFAHVSIRFVFKHPIVSPNAWRFLGNVIFRSSSKNWSSKNWSLVSNEAIHTLSSSTLSSLTFPHGPHFSISIQKRTRSRSCSSTISSMPRRQNRRRRMNKKIARTNHRIFPEAKTNQTANVMESLDRLIPSDNKLHICIDPLRQQLSSNNDLRQISKCETCL